MRGRAGAAVRRPVGRLCPWPVSCEKYETGIILHCRSEIVELVRHVISARAGATGGATSHRPDTWDMHMYAIRAFGV
jgi:hypothetical protein